MQEAQVQNYETQRSEFEAYIDHSTNKDAPSTGVVYWQLNKGWPTLLWDLYNNDYDQAGSYFGAKKANEPLHVLYTYDDGTVSVDNVGERDRHGLSVVSNVYGVDGALLDHQTASGVSVDSQGVARDVLIPRYPPPPPRRHPQRRTSSSCCERHGKVIDRNVYWLSTQQDVVDWDATIGQPQATMTQFANLSQLQALPAGGAGPSPHGVRAWRPREDGGEDHQHVERADGRVFPSCRRPAREQVGDVAAGDNEVLPISWSDNDVTLWPGDSETLHATYRRADSHGSRRWSACRRGTRRLRTCRHRDQRFELTSSPRLPTASSYSGRPIRSAARCAAARVAGSGRSASHTRACSYRSRRRATPVAVQAELRRTNHIWNRCHGDQSKK